VNYCVEYNILFHCTFIVDLSSLVTVYVWNLSRKSIILTFFAISKVSIRFSIDAMECLLPMRCCANLGLPFPYLKSRKCRSDNFNVYNLDVSCYR
jgi:hypothetical protein